MRKATVIICMETWLNENVNMCNLSDCMLYNNKSKSNNTHGSIVYVKDH